ncbi:MAG: SUMF1/EgtB/PvdO family nonheme iron enzyme [Hyphomicrobiales bacterium]|nr:SUMF1/EgtB/PvdO family nonheme iron enzyme [Hyphomicrobiales bacterium]
MPSDSGWGRGWRPVIDISWHDAGKFAARLSRKMGAEYRLLTEAEWEYAARAGTMAPYSTGNTITERYAHFGGSRTVRVGRFPANRFGLQDMGGTFRIRSWTAGRTTTWERQRMVRLGA